MSEIPCIENSCLVYPMCKYKERIRCSILHCHVVKFQEKHRGKIISRNPNTSKIAPQYTTTGLEKYLRPHLPNVEWITGDI